MIAKVIEYKVEYKKCYRELYYILTFDSSFKLVHLFLKLFDMITFLFLFFYKKNIWHDYITFYTNKTCGKIVSIPIANDYKKCPGWSKIPSHT